MTPDAGPVRALIGRGEVRHTRLRPVRRALPLESPQRRQVA